VERAFNFIPRSINRRNFNYAVIIGSRLTWRQYGREFNFTTNSIAVATNIGARSKIARLGANPGKCLIVSVLLAEFDTNMAELSIIYADISIIKICTIRRCASHAN
jgi:hypothetical protein